MPRHAANLSTQFGDVGFLDRFAAAAQAGYEGVEFLFPYSYPVEQIAHRLCSHGLRLVHYCLPAGDWVGGERGIACHPDRIAEFRYGVDEAIRYARALGVLQLRCLAGVPPAGVTPAQARLTLVNNLRDAAGMLKPHGIALLIVPQADYPGYYLRDHEQAQEIVRAVGADNLRLHHPTA